jgi:hypothetical protein
MGGPPPVLPKRFIVFTHGNGWIRDSYTCVARSETDFDLGPSYTALAPYKDKLVILSQFYNPYTNDGGFNAGLHGNGWGTLAVTRVSANDTVHPGATCCGEHFTPGSITLDRFISKQAPFNADRFPLTALGPDWAGAPMVPSGDGPGQPTPAMSDPLQAYDKYFANFAGSGMGNTNAAQLLAQEKSVLDFMRADIARMNSRLAAPERARMDQYLQGLRTVEQQLGALAKPASCTAPPAKPGNASGLQAQLAAMVDVTFAAQMCGLNHVSHVSFFGVDGPQIKWGFLGPTQTTDEHNLHHQNDESSGPNYGKLTEPIRQVDAYILSLVARMIENLSKVPEGNGTMLDNSLVMYVNAAGGKHHNGENLHAVLLAGGAGGALRTGRYLTFPSMQHAISDVYVSVANMLGVPITTFGDPAICKGPLPGLA